MNILFRTDSSIDIGTGHVMRCLTLADEIGQKDNNIGFICREEKGSIITLIESKGYNVHLLPAGIDTETDRELTREILQKQRGLTDWLVVDHYGLGSLWESPLRNELKKIMVIDDLADRKHDCDILLDQNFNVNDDRYSGLTPEHCITLLGPKYALLRPQFLEARKNRKERIKGIKRILIFMGGTDPKNETCKVLRAAQKASLNGVALDIVIGASNPHRSGIEDLASGIPDATCHYSVKDMAALMSAADLCIGSGGTSTWERCCLGLPSLLISIADNQEHVAQELAGKGCAVYSGWHESLTEHDLAEDINFLLRHKELVSQISLQAKKLVDGKGAERVKTHLLNNMNPISLRPAVEADCQKIFEWRNHPDVRKYSHNTEPLSQNEHTQWFQKAISSADTSLLIAESGNDPVGVLRYDFKNGNAFVSIYVVPGNFGKGYGSSMLSVGNTWIRTHHKNTTKVLAEIIPQNTLSLNAFKKAGFKEIHSTYIYTLS